MTLSEWEAYQNTFNWKEKHRTGYLDSKYIKLNRLKGLAHK